MPVYPNPSGGGPPFYVMRLRGGPWLPSSVAGLSGWWVSDNPANTLVSGFLNTIADKSTVGNTLTPQGGSAGNEATVVASVLNGRSIWRGDSVSKKAAFVMSNVSLSQNVSGVSLGAVYRSGPAGGTADQSVVRINANGGNIARAMIGRGSFASNAVYAGGRRLDADAYDGANDNTDYSTNWLILVASLDYGNASLVLSVNGTTTTDAAFQTAGNTSNTSSFTSGVGNRGDGANNAYGDYAEVMAYQGALDTSNRQKLEGYLAWQWGLAGSLPGGHPYAAAAPNA